MPDEPRIRAEDSPPRHEGTEQEEKKVKKIGRKDGRRSDSYLPTFLPSSFLTFSSLRLGGEDSWETKPISGETKQTVPRYKQSQFGGQASAGPLPAWSPGAAVRNKANCGLTACHARD